jgi:sugar lactone lactonase YvrE
VDRKDDEIFVSDGENTGGNHRIAVMDHNGMFLRQWSPEGMRTVHCMIVANDGWVYVCNREAARIQVYDKTGKLTKTFELPWKPETPPADGKPKESGGAVVSIAFSPDSNQRLMYVINQNNGVVEVVERESGKILSTFGRIGHFPGEFDQPHGIAVDSESNVYIAENRGKRVQKFKVVGK